MQRVLSTSSDHTDYSSPLTGTATWIFSWSRQGHPFAAGNKRKEGTIEKIVVAKAGREWQGQLIQGETPSSTTVIALQTARALLLSHTRRFD